MEEKLLEFIDKYKDVLKNKRVAVAVSGGIDSLSLLLVFNRWAQINNTTVFALTVDHGLRKESKDEAIYINNLCKNLSVEHHILVWDGEKPEKNIEMIARENRYRLMTDFCHRNNIKHLLVAHHLQDQAETFFIRLFRGSGLDGLSSIKSLVKLYEIEIIRPFLKAKKEELKKYLEEKQVKWVEDFSNSDEKYLRNKIRIFLNSFEDKDIILERIDKTIDKIAIAKDIIDENVKKIENKAVFFSPFGSCSLDRNFILKQNEEIILKILAKIAMIVSGNIYKPRFEKLKRLLENIRANKKIKYTFYGCVFEAYDDNLIMIYREYNSILEDKNLIFNEEIIWDNRFKITLKSEEKNLIITHIKEGEFNKIMQKTRLTNFSKYKEMKDIKGIEKNIFYTLPVVKNGDEYLLEYTDIEIKFINNLEI